MTFYEIINGDLHHQLHYYHVFLSWASGGSEGFFPLATLLGSQKEQSLWWRALMLDGFCVILKSHYT
jgi:hypothetical protein